MTTCTCKIGYDGSQCETGHDYAKNPCLRDQINSCNERGLTNDECILDAVGVDKSVKSIDELVKLIDSGDVMLSTMISNLETKVTSSCKQELPTIITSVLSTLDGQRLHTDIFRGLSTLAKLFGDDTSSDSEQQRPTNMFTDWLTKIGGFNEDSFTKIKTNIERRKQKLQEQHQHTSDSGVEEVIKKCQKKFANLLK